MSPLVNGLSLCTSLTKCIKTSNTNPSIDKKFITSFWISEMWVKNSLVVEEITSFSLAKMSSSIVKLALSMSANSLSFCFDKSLPNRWSNWKIKSGYVVRDNLSKLFTVRILKTSIVELFSCDNERRSMLYFFIKESTIMFNVLINCISMLMRTRLLGYEATILTCNWSWFTFSLRKIILLILEIMYSW